MWERRGGNTAGYPSILRLHPLKGAFIFILLMNTKHERETVMKTMIKSTVAIVLSVAFILCLVACGEKVDATGLWENATYLRNTTVGKGEKTVTVDVECADQKITLTVKTDKATLGEALYELELINDASFFDTLNGIKADWNKDKAYWAFYEGENYMMVGVADAKISGGEHYRLVYTKG